MQRTDTIIARGVDQLGIEMILVGPPQAKRRVERSFGTAQDRLVQVMEMRMEGTGGLAKATASPSSGGHRLDRAVRRRARGLGRHPPPLPAGVDLEAAFAETEKRWWPPTGKCLGWRTDIRRNDARLGLACTVRVTARRHSVACHDWRTMNLA